MNSTPGSFWGSTGSSSSRSQEDSQAPTAPERGAQAQGDGPCARCATRTPLRSNPGQQSARTCPADLARAARALPESVSADKAYSNRRTRRYLRRRGIRHVIPEKSDQAANRVRRGRAGGRPPGFDKERSTVERAINKFKNYRAGSTRYDKRVYVYLGTVTLVATVI
ncbi:transposase [Streptomyces sp. NPDC127033]|uniref:transposase n=1 Tax=Streptomyces sp. NPDC127033 TaxID=3347110 RepID=UPI0036505034